jgi:DNA-binding transcriptional MocR family regulator
MPTIKTRPVTGFAQIPNKTLQDTTITSKARGILTYLLSFPEDWTVSIQALSKQLIEGRDSISAAFDELIAAGYVSREQERRKDGSFGELTYYVYAEKQAQSPLVDAPIADKPITENPISVNPISVNPISVNPISVNPTAYKEDIYKEDIYKETIKNVEQHDEFSDFVNFWNSEKNLLWASCEKLNQQRVNLLRRLIKDEGTSALEIFQKAVKFGRQDKFWREKRMTIDNILRHTRELADRYLETPNGHVISDSDLSMAARIKETQELADRLAKKYNYNGVNNNA